MEYCGGGTLQEIAAQGLREEMVRHYTRDLLKAVETLHNKEIVHRNIKGIVIKSTRSSRLVCAESWTRSSLSHAFKLFPDENLKELS